MSAAQAHSLQKGGHGKGGGGMRAELTGAWRGGRVAAPPSKSMAHRALICAALAQGESRIENIAHSKDIDATAGALGAIWAPNNN